jgi:aryl-alcohol dehydrogenase-like predicted oxidoreductase
LREFVAALIRRGEIDPTEVNAQAPLDFVLASGEAISIPDVAYRFCRDEPGVHVVLSGTGNAEHLTSNLETFGRPSLSPESTQRLEHIFRAVVSTAGQNL